MTSHNDFISRLSDRLLEDATPASLAAMLIRTGSVQGRELLAHAASRGELDYEGLTALAPRPGISASERSAALRKAARLDPDRLLQVARIAALQGGDEADPDLAMGLFELVYISHGAESFDRDAGTLYAQLLVRHGRLGPLREVLPSLEVSANSRWAVELDAINPFTGLGDSIDAWLAKLNKRPIGEIELEPVGVTDALEQRPFDRLTSTSSTVRSPETITVVMPTYCPDHTIFTAVRSILAQSWDNLELIIVDDASPDEYRRSLEAVAALDPRIQLIRASVNRGVYAARNLGLAFAKGEFVTFQDCDDWSHPRRLELQVAPLREAATGFLATRSRMIRAFPDLTFTLPGQPPDQMNPSSLLYRREAVTELIGGFDHVRKAADAEFSRRLEAVAPGSVFDLPDRSPLAITQRRAGSLSRADAVPGWKSWARRAYHDAYTFWHSRISLAGAPAHVSVGRPRSFPLPDFSWDPERADRAPSRGYDVLIVNDWRIGRGSHQQSIGEIQMMIDHGLRVALAHLETPYPLPERREIIARSVQELINSSAVDFVHLSQRISAELVMVHDPATLQFLPRMKPAVKAAKVAVLCELPEEGAEFRYRVEDCSTNAGYLFRRQCIWLPRSRRARTYLAERLQGARLADFDLPLAFNRSRLLAPVHRPSPHLPVIGRHANGHGSNWPATRRDLLSAYPDDDRFDVRLMGDRSPVEKLLAGRRMPANWIWFDRDQLSVRSFLAQLDFFVCFPHPPSGLNRNSAALEAIASGCVAIVDRRFKSALGEAAVYCEPGQVQEVILALYESPSDFHDQQQRGWAKIESADDVAAFLGGLERLMSSDFR